jgi:hypothetical protein
MDNHLSFAAGFAQICQPTERGVVGLVDDLLQLSQHWDIELDWHAGRCRARCLYAAPAESVDLPLSRPIFRAVLARLAALCNERRPDSVSPYGGSGELTVSTDPPAVRRVVFANTTGEARAQLTRVPKAAESSSGVAGVGTGVAQDGLRVPK